MADDQSSSGEPDAEKSPGGPSAANSPGGPDAENEPSAAAADADADADATRPVPPDPDATRSVDPDETRPASSIEPDAARAGSVDSDETRPLPADQDATRPTPAVEPDASRLPPAVDPYTPDADSTGDNATTHVIRPPTPDPTTAFKPEPSTWRGSAGVRPGDPAADRTAAWSPEPPSGRRAWWLPIVLGIIGLLVLIGVAYALVHALNNSGPAQPVITPSTSTAPVTPSTVPSTPPSAPPSAPPSTPPSAPPSSIAPSSAAPSTPGSASTVVIPSTLTGLLFPDVDAELNALGLKYMLVPQIDNDPSVIPNTVLSTDPSAGTPVAAGTVVKVVYAARSVSASPATAAQ